MNPALVDRVAQNASFPRQVLLTGKFVKAIGAYAFSKRAHEIEITGYKLQVLVPRRAGYRSYLTCKVR
jgi:hypothetical protein